jgi:hypothetical protein
MYATVRRYEGVTDPSEAGRRVNDYTARCNRNEGCSGLQNDSLAVNQTRNAALR